MSYYHDKDLEGEGTIDATKLNESLTLCVNRIRTAFSKLNETHNANFRGLMDELFSAFLSTHKSIRLLLKESYNDPDYAPDAKSLTREQVEKVFIVTLILDDPDRWIEVYFKDDWRRLYKFLYLTEAEETKNLPRYKDWQKESYQMMEQMRSNSFVTDAEKELIEHKFNNPGVAKPAHLAGIDVHLFPMPKLTLASVQDQTKLPLLERWHREYEFLCGYSHVGADKLVGSAIRKTRLNDADKKEFFEREMLFSTFYVSCIAGASLCTEAWRYISKYDADLSKSGDFLASILDFWTMLRETSLKGKLFWDIHANHVFPPTIGTES